MCSGCLGLIHRVVVVIATRRAADDRKVLAAVGRALDRLTGQINRVRIARIECHAGEVGIDDRSGLVDADPVHPAVIRPIQAAARLGGNARVHPGSGLGMPYGQPDATQTTLGQTLAGYACPGPAVVARLVDTAAQSHRGHEVTQPRPLACRPGAGIEMIRIGRVGGDVDRARVGAHVQGTIPAFAPVGRTEYATLLVGAVDVTKCCDQHDVGVARVDVHGADMMCVGQAHRLPAATAIAGAVDPIARADVVALFGLPGAHIDHLRVGGSDGQRANGGHSLLVEYRRPGLARVDSLPHTAPGIAGVISVGLVSDTRCDRAPAGTEWADQAPFESTQHGRRERVAGGRRRTGMQSAG